MEFDSRSVQENSAFFCIKGENVDGHDFIQAAIKNGAKLIVADEKNKNINNSSDINFLFVPCVREAMALASLYFYELDKFLDLRIIGVTGTNGKTTTTHLIAQTLSREFSNKKSEKIGLMGTLGAKIFENGEEIEFLGEGTGRTTEQAPHFYKTIADLYKKGCKKITMEVSSHALEQKRVFGCPFKTGVFTNLTQDHLDYHVTMQSYFQAKSILFKNLEHNIINLDDDWSNELIKYIKNNNSEAKILTFSAQNEKADLFARNIYHDTNGISCELELFGRKLGRFVLPLFGKFNLYNAMASFLVCLSEGISEEACAQNLFLLKAAKGRFQVVEKYKENLPTCIIDYAHTPDGLKNVLETAREILNNRSNKQGKLVCLFGCGGDRDTTKRPIMGKIAEKYSDRVIISSDNPRTEDPEQIIADILSGISSLDKVTVEGDRHKAIKDAVKFLNAEDVFVLAGKGHETYQILADKTIHFDDYEEVSEALKEHYS